MNIHRDTYLCEALTVNHVTHSECIIISQNILKLITNKNVIQL